MSSETSTKKSRRTARRESPPSAAAAANRPPAVQPDEGPEEVVHGFQPGHLFLIGGLLASSVAAIAVRGSRPENIIFVCLTVLSAAGAAYAFYRTIWPLVQPESVRTPEMLGGRTRAALEREKVLVLRAIKELEFDRAMGKVSDEDYQEMTGRLRTRAVRLIKQLDSGAAAYHEVIERELAARGGGAARAAARNGAATGSAALVIALAVGVSLLAAPVSAQMSGMGGGGMGMPDARAMSGIPRPSETVPAGGVSVRLVRGQLSNNIVGHPVSFDVDGKVQTVNTGETGHAIISGVPAGASVRATATVDGEKLESQVFEMPSGGGVVLMLVATDKTAAQQMEKSAVPGTVRIGGQSRIVTEFQDEELEVFYLFDFVNAGSAPVKMEPIVFQLPDGAKNASILEGSAPNAIAKGGTVTVMGPFAPGSTQVQIAFSMPSTARISLHQQLPVALDSLSVMMEKTPSMTVSSPQLPNIQEGSEGTRRFIIGSGPGLKAGDTLTLHLAGLPHHATWPRNLALLLAVIVLAVGTWYAAKPGPQSGKAALRQQVERRRERVLGEVVALDRRYKAGEIDERVYQERRATLMSELERIYGELDTDQGLAA